MGLDVKNVGGFNFQQTFVGNDQAAWVSGLPADVQAALKDLSSAPPEMRSKIAEGVIDKAMTSFDDAAKTAKLTDAEKTLFRATLKDSLAQATGTVLMDREAGVQIANMSLEDLMFFVMSERTKQLDKQVRGFAEEIQQRNNLMSLANDMLSKARNISATLEDDDTAAMPAEMAMFFDEHGIEYETADASGSAASSAAKGATEADLTTLITETDGIIDDVDDIGYTDNACIKKDVPENVMNFCAEHGLDVPNDGQDLSKDDINELKGTLSTFKSNLNAEKTKLKSASSGSSDASAAAAAASGKSFTSEQWQANIENLKGFLEGLNNQSQLDMIKYQSTMSKFTTSVEMLSNSMKKLEDNKAAVVRNMA